MIVALLFFSPQDTLKGSSTNFYTLKCFHVSQSITAGVKRVV